MNEYGLIYWIEYFDYENKLIRLEISKKGYSGSSTQIQGYVKFNYEDRKELFKPIISSSLDITLEADSNLTLQDLYSEEERTFSSVLKRDGQVLFIGYIKPDGIWADLVSDKWEITLDCIDGTSTLKDLTFINNNGNNFTGRMKQLDVIRNCLLRIGYDLPINVFIDIVYDDVISGEPAYNSILERIYINTERYYQDSNKKEAMDCEAVLKSMLQIYSATIFQYNGEWYIIRIPSYRSSITFKRYVNGIFSNDNTINVNGVLGSDINGFYPCHCNANQRQSIDASIQAYRVKFQFGTVKSAIRNPELINGGTLPFDGWFIGIDSDVHPLPSNGVVSDTFHYPVYKTLIANVGNEVEIKTTDKIKLSIDFFNNEWSVGLRYALKTATHVLINGNWVTRNSGNEEHYDTVENFEWDLWGPGTDARLYKRGKGSANFTMDIPSVPSDSLLTIYIIRDFYDYEVSKPVMDGYFGVTRIDFIPDANTNVKGQYFTSQRKNRVSTVTKEDLTIYNGDSESSIYYSSLSLWNGSLAISTTSKWKRLDNTELEPRYLASMIPEDVLRSTPVPAMIYEGDVLGYMPFISLFKIEELNSNFIFSKYSYDTRTCISRVNARQFFTGYLPSTEYRDNKFFEPEIDFGEETKVTIKS
ncbi:hypothetical protein [Elizabethkingia anophelis]|uniref:hypothetical protein n=1 Tax=Elizabethkingia anophelis TaxID=1117645 RepID=UPI003892A945